MVESWPEMEQFPCSSTFDFNPQPENRIKNKFLETTDAGIDLLTNIFVYNPQHRATAETCLQSVYFIEQPLREYSADLVHNSIPSKCS